MADKTEPISHLEKVIAKYGRGSGGSSGGSGTSDYDFLLNKPSINGVELSGDKSLAELGITNYDDTQVKTDITDLQNNKVNKSGDTMTGTLTIKKSGDDATLLTFDTERAWSFKQGNTGASASLDLVSSNNDKSFRVLNTDKTKGLEVRITPTKTEVKIDDNKVYHAGDKPKLSELTDNALDTTDKTVLGAINEVNGNQLDTVGFSSDYKNIIINRKNGLNPYTIPISAIIHNAKLTELNDIDSTNIADGKTLVYDGATQKHKYVDSTGTDELVKMDSTTDAKHLSELIDKSTVVNDNGVLKVKKLDGQNVTIAEINHLKGLTMNVMDLVNTFANGGVKVYEHTIPTYADLLALDRSGFIDGIKYFVYVQSDETHGSAKTTYICDKKSTSYFCVSGDHRDFTTDPIDLANEVTGKLGTANIDVNALWKLLTINDTYKTLTTKDEVFGTHGAKALYDELVASMGKKANATDLTTHTSDTNIHITSAERTKWNKVDNKVDKTDITTTINSTSTDTQVPSAKSVYNLAGNENRRGYVYNNPTYRGDTWNRVFRVNSLLSCDSGFLTVTVYSNGLCQIATFLMSKNFNRLNIKQINCGGYNGNNGKGRPIKVRIVSAETIGYSFLEIFVSGTANTNVVATYMPLSCNSVVVLNEEGSIPNGMFACEMTATHDTYENATYTSILK